ncbi:hypothetical protein BV25DRAFT_418734 [Artomyces pyxidatus]|uniref:Uncharacterized protein n=1 Tax=Artomyces pyxidatus TaxID=48021 RepID=A0ACB8T4L6_9AGAM|nr:hypothetical protein BV25DRAFT_418734 [Artomyces pyxidatus]
MSLPTLALPYPLILLPSARLTLPISQAQADAILSLIDASPGHTTLAAIPTIQTKDRSSQPHLHEWGVSARISRLVRPPSRSTQPYLLTIQGLTRVRLTAPERFGDPDHLPLLPVSYPPVEGDLLPPPDVVSAFKAAAVSLLDRLAQSNPRKRDIWARLAAVVEEADVDRAAGLPDLVVSSVGAEYEERLREYCHS